MNDSKVSITATLAWVAWGLSLMFLGASWAVSGDVHTTTEGMTLCTFAIMLAAAAATLHTRSFFCGFSRRILDVYEMGMERGHAEERENWKVPLQRV